MNIYICYYKGKRIEVSAETSYAAQKLAVEQFTVRNRVPKGYDINVVLAEQNGEPVIYNGTEFN